MQAKDPTTCPPQKPCSEVNADVSPDSNLPSPTTPVSESVTETPTITGESKANKILETPVPQPERPATMMEVIGWEMTQALYHAHKLVIQPPTAKQREKRTWNEGQHRQYLIETAKLITALLVEVSTQAAARAKEAMNARQLSDTTVHNQSGEGQGQVEERSEVATPSIIVVPEGFGR